METRAAARPEVYTHARWRVRAGREDDFVAAWTALAETFGALDSPPAWGTLLRSANEPTVFYSFGRWDSDEAVAAMRAAQDSGRSMAALMELCEEATPELCHAVKQIRR